MSFLVMFAFGFFDLFAIGGEFPEIGKPMVGWDGYYVVGRWTPVIVPITGPVEAPPSGQLELVAIDSDGNRVGFLSPEVTFADGARRQLVGMMKVGRLDGDVVVRLNDRFELRGTPGRSDWLKEPLKPSARLIVTVGDPHGFDFPADLIRSGTVVKVVPVKANELPVNSLAFDSVSLLVLAGSEQISSEQAAALREWVAGGGQLVISLSHDVAAARKLIAPLADWLPVTVGDQPIIVREFGGLETYAGKNIRIPQASTLSIPNLQTDTGVVLAASRSDSFLVRVPYGQGAVMVLAMDLTAAPLSEWKALHLFCARLAGLPSSQDGSEKSLAKGSQLSSTGINDLATQVHAIQEHFDRVDRASPWFVMGLLLALLVVVGPIDYLLVHRLLKRPQLTWISYPLLVAAISIVATSMATSSNGNLPHTNQLDIVTVDVETATARGRHFVTLYSPTTSQSSISVESLPLAKAGSHRSMARVCWQGVPESAFGGMLRGTGLDYGASYQQHPDGHLTELPLMQWSSKALVAQSIQPVEGLVNANLRASTIGRLTGTITHRFADSIEDWMVVYKTVVYRHLKQKDDSQSLPFPPNQVWRVDQPSVYSRELRPYLTGIITMASPRFGETAPAEATQLQSNYDSLSLDPASLIRILTFHDEIGGERYTGLTNYLLEDEDCSNALKLGRAILFGRLKQPVATVQQDEKAVEPDRQTSFIRLILPVAKSTEVLRGLRRVVPENN